MRQLILVVASVSIILCEPVLAAPEIVNTELRQAVCELNGVRLNLNSSSLTQYIRAAETG